jgi:hypothetical protein
VSGTGVIGLQAAGSSTLESALIDVPEDAGNIGSLRQLTASLQARAGGGRFDLAIWQLT